MMEIEQDELIRLQTQIDILKKELEQLKPTTQKPDKFLKIGINTRLAQGIKLFASEGKEIIIGDNVNINRGAEILGPVTIGDNCLLSRDAYIRSHTVIGKHVALGPFVRLITDTHEIGSAVRRAGKHYTKPITIGDGAWIGAGTIVLPGVTIGAGAVVGAGSIVTKDVQPNTKAYGVPAESIGTALP